MWIPLAVGVGAGLVTMLRPVWPLPEWPREKVGPFGPGTARGVGAARESLVYNGKPTKAHVHAGIDIGPPSGGGKSRALGARVVAPMPGKVTKIGGWRTGSRRVEILTPAGLIVLGALKDLQVKEGDLVFAGEDVARLAAYPNGTTQLHGELWAALERGRWEKGQPRPAALRDLSKLLRWAR
jgi:murein DD-endopeptidase MepM/ murein hydrolase activator NlpD